MSRKRKAISVSNLDTIRKTAYRYKGIFVIKWQYGKWQTFLNDVYTGEMFLLEAFKTRIAAEFHCDKILAGK